MRFDFGFGRGMRRRGTQWAAALAATVLMALPAAAGEVRFFRSASRADFLPGSFDGVRIDQLGTLRLANRARRAAALEEPFLFSADGHAGGWVVGTGNAGKVLAVDRDGTVEELFAADEPEIFAVLADADGTVFAGSSPNGKVYRIREGEATVFFDPGETYIWDLARRADGTLLVATGTEGRLYAVDEAGEGSVLFDSQDTHIRTLEPLPDGRVVLGTAGQGLVLLLDSTDRARTLYDSTSPEVVDIGVADGDFYAALVSSEASLIESAPAGASTNGEGNGNGAEGGTVRVSVSVNGGESFTPPDNGAPRSEVVRLSAAGLVESVARFDEETVYALLWMTDRLWIGTGLEGKLYSLQGTKLVLEKDVEERQVMGLMADGAGPAFATTNAAALYQISDEPERRGTYESQVLDAAQVARFGTLHWQGTEGGAGEVTFAFRSGLSAFPDATWSEWSAERSGRQVALDGVPPGRFLQWRATFDSAGGEPPALGAVTVSYRQNNVKPRISELSVLDAGQVLVPSNFNPSNQVFEPASPNRDGIFTALNPARENDDQRLKTLWKRGFRTLRWKAEDGNGDDIEYRIDFRTEDDPDGWLEVAGELEETYYSFDATVLPDGVYRFRLSASDAPANADDEALETEEVSGPVTIDHSPPVLDRVTRRSATVEATVRDGLSPLREAVVSVDAGPWRPAAAADGLVDGMLERFALEVPADATVVLLRVMDTSFNVRTFDLTDSGS